MPPADARFIALYIFFVCFSLISEMMLIKFSCLNIRFLSKYKASTMGTQSKTIPRFALHPTTSIDALMHSYTLSPISMLGSQIISEHAIEACKKSL